MNEFNFRVTNAAPRASGFEIGKNVGDTKTTYIYSYKTKYINGESTGQKSNVDWDMESSIPSWVSVKYAFEGNDCKVTCGDQRKEVPIRQKAAESSSKITINWPTGTDLAAFFQSGESPQPGSGLSSSYFSMSVLDNRTTHNYSKDVGLVVNKRDGKTNVLPGQWVSCYRYMNGGWSYVGKFMLPSSDTTVTL